MEEVPNSAPAMATVANGDAAKLVPIPPCVLIEMTAVGVPANTEAQRAAPTARKTTVGCEAMLPAA